MERRTAPGWNLIGLAILALAPGVVLYLGGFEAPDSKSMALALLALIAIVPEYIVDATFAWVAAEDSAYAGYAVANITSKYKGSVTRMLIKDIPSVIGLAFLLISLVLGVALAIAMLGQLLPVR